MLGGMGSAVLNQAEGIDDFLKDRLRCGTALPRFVCGVDEAFTRGRTGLLRKDSAAGLLECAHKRTVLDESGLRHQPKGFPGKAVDRVEAAAERGGFQAIEAEGF